MRNRYKLFIVALLLSNLAVGVAGFYAVVSLDRRYSDLFDSSLNTLNRGQALAWEVWSVKTAANRFSDSAPEGRPALLERAARSAQATDRLVREFSASPVTMADPGASADLLALHADFRRDADLWAAAAAAQDLRRAHDINVSILRPDYDRYAAAIMKANDAVEQREQIRNDDLTHDSATFGRLLLVAASWPLWLALLLGVGLLLVFTVTVGWTAAGSDRD